MPIAPAIGAALIGGASSIYSASQSKKAASKASAAQEAAAAKQLAAQQAALDRITGLNQPFITGGSAAFQKLLTDLGVAPSGRPASTVAPTGTRSYDAAGNIVASPAAPPLAAVSGLAGAKAEGGPAGVSPMEPAASPSAASAPAPDYGAYLQTYPDVGAEFQRLQSTPEGQAHLQSLGATSPEAFAEVHYRDNGQTEGRTLPTTAPAATGEPEVPQQAQDTSRPNAALAPEFDRSGVKMGDYGDAPNMDSFFSNFEASPDYQFRLNEGMKGVNAASAVRGKLRSGDAGKALLERSSNIAGSEYGNWFNRQMQKFTAARGGFESDRTFQGNMYDRQNQNFNNDRAYDTSMWQYGTDRGDTNFNVDRSYSDSRSDNSTDNLFRAAGLGLAGAGNVAGAVTNQANAASGIFGRQADAADDAAYAKSNANAGMVGGVAGAATNLFANWGGGGGGSSAPAQPFNQNGFNAWARGSW
jgi:hypothetical protein